MNGFALLLVKIEDFIKRFYLNRLLRGGLLFAGLTLAVFLFLVNLEYFVFFGSTVRTILFFGFVTLVFSLFWFFILDPLLKLYKVGKRLSYEDAGRMLGKLIPGIEDKILNTLQLSSLQSSGLALAAIEQKSKELAKHPFSSAIDFRQNRRYLWFVFPVLSVMILVFMFNPKIILSGSERLYNFNQTYVPDAPFNFVLLSGLSPVEEGSDVEIKVRLSGSDIPKKVFLESNYGRFLMTESSKNEFSFVLSKLRQDLSFSFIASDYKSSVYDLPVFGNSALVSLKMEMQYPAYTGRLNEVLDNPMSVMVPAGTKIRLIGSIKNGSSVQMSLLDTVFSISPQFRVEYRFLKSQVVNIGWKNKFSMDTDAVERSIDVIPDLYPVIDLNRSFDSLSNRLVFFNGLVNDDYGISGLNFVNKFIF